MSLKLYLVTAGLLAAVILGLIVWRKLTGKRKVVSLGVSAADLADRQQKDDERSTRYEELDEEVLSGDDNDWIKERRRLRDRARRK